MNSKIQAFLPHLAISWLANLMANCKIRWLKNFLIRDFIRRYQVDMSLAVEADYTAYSCFNTFFTRQLKPELRPLPANPDTIACPADGIISQLGKIDQQQIFQAKGYRYGLSDLLADSAVENFANGHFATVYLSPKDYHRVHMPIDGTLQKMTYVPGRLFSVNQQSAATIDNLFARNERVICYFETELGQMAVILVGAMIVGSIETSWHGTISPPHLRNIQHWSYHSDHSQQIHLKQGEELGLFKLGSTVILLFQENKINWESKLLANSTVKVNENIASFKHST